MTKKILLIATRQIGDVLLVTPLLRSLRYAYPQATIDILVNKGKGEILIGNPDYNNLISVTEHPDFAEYKVLFKQIFRNYDLAISTLAGDRPLLYAILAAPKRVAIVPPKRWQDAWKRLLVDAWTELDDRCTPTVVQNLRLADLLNIPRCNEVVTPQLNDSIEILDSLLPFKWQEQNFAVLHLVPLRHYKRWTVSGWKDLIEYLLHKKLYVVLTGGYDESEMEYIQNVVLDMPNTVVNVAGKLRFADVAKLIKNGKIYVGPDTSITHLAAATGIPTVALFGPTNPQKWSPWPCNYNSEVPFQRKGSQTINNVTLLQGPGDCVPCHQEGCYQHRESSSRCLEELSCATVIEAVNGLIGD
ncbi:glycosyltransferase family 9 protein [Candidatus Halobeggiatoa sp. HSG11]|nr:glycosyltransferase family 9 protein [Candidatus Halobeggiatoa sp. HSG11]